MRRNLFGRGWAGGGGEESLIWKGMKAPTHSKLIVESVQISQINAGSPGVSVCHVLKSKFEASLCPSVTTRWWVCRLFWCQLPPAARASSAQPQHCLCLGCSPQQCPAAAKHVFPSEDLRKLGRLHRQTAGYYLSQPEDVIISEVKVEQTVGTGGFLPRQVSGLESNKDHYDHI